MSDLGVRQRLDALRERIDRLAPGRAGEITIVAVTKSFGVGHVAAAIDAGLSDIGENYAQEAVEKWTALEAIRRSRARLHFIGRLQTNKIRTLAPHVALWQTVDRGALVEQLARHAPGAQVLVQVNISDEPSKGGCRDDEAAALVAHATDAGLQVLGLMGVGPAGDPELARPAFRRLRSLVDRLALPVCSMGMTDDLEVAVSQGATMVRVGSALFGPRPRKADLRH